MFQYYQTYTACFWWSILNNLSICVWYVGLCFASSVGLCEVKSNQFHPQSKCSLCFMHILCLLIVIMGSITRMLFQKINKTLCRICVVNDILNWLWRLTRRCMHSKINVKWFECKRPHLKMLSHFQSEWNYISVHGCDKTMTFPSNYLHITAECLLKGLFSPRELP